MKYFYLFLLLGLSLPGAAQTPVWSTDVAPIIYNRCATCHRNGGIAPFSLLGYNDAIAHASTIKTQIQQGTMPPWPPDPKYTHLAHERVLSWTEKSKILAWLNGGRPRGDSTLEPPKPTFPANGDLTGTADLVLKIPTYTSTAASGDVYRCFVLPTGLTADRFISAFEAVPGNRSIVHHVVVYADTTGVSTGLDAADAGPGYTSFGGIGTSDAVLVGGWLPGASPAVYPTGFGIRLSKNAKLVLQIHYPAGTAGMQDSTELHIFFTPTNNVRNLMMLPVLNHEVNINAPLSIPANSVQQYTEQQAVPFDVTVFGITPHMHLIGRQIQSFGVTPAGDTQRFISIPEWDFHWQGTYMLRQAMKVAAGSTVYANATYDNTTNNPNNPSNPPKNVAAGEATTDEMMLVYFLFTNYQTGDEQIVIDSTPIVGIQTPYTYYKGVTLLQPYPVPANNQIVIKYYLEKATEATLEFFNVAGQPAKQVCKVQKLPAGYSALPVDVSDLPTGTYTLRLQTADALKAQSVIIQH